MENRLKVDDQLVEPIADQVPNSAQKWVDTSIGTRFENNEFAKAVELDILLQQSFQGDSPISEYVRLRWGGKMNERD